MHPQKCIQPRRKKGYNQGMNYFIVDYKGKLLSDPQPHPLHAINTMYARLMKPRFDIM
jgi:hypothetical protein